jgi:hypothetical protein
VTSTCARAVLAVAVVGCGASSQPPPSGPSAPVAVDEDVAIDAGQVALTGERYQPAAVPPPSMLLVRGPRKATLERLRAAVARSRGDRRAGAAKRALDVHLLATALFEAARIDPARRAALLAEAQAAVAEVRARDGAATDEVTLVMGAALAFAVDDAAGAEPYLAELSARFGDRSSGLAAKTQLAYARLRDGDDAIALALVSGQTPAAARPEQAYVIAWTRLRAGDGPGAAAAITLAAQGWTAAASQAAIDRDFVLMHAASGLPLAVSADAVAAVSGAPARQAALFTQLATAYGFAGRPAQAAEALARALAVTPTPTPAATAVGRRMIAEFVRRTGTTEQQRAAWLAALDAARACVGCADEHQAIGDAVAARAVEAHTVFATTGDLGYRALADELYQRFAALPEAAARADRARVAEYAADFARLSAPTDNTQYGDVVPALLAVRQAEVLGCLEAGLQRDPSSGGILRLTLEVDRAGAVTGAATEPARGEGGLAGVAGCVEDRARQWRLPTRPRPGIARITVRYVLGAKP